MDRRLKQKILIAAWFAVFLLLGFSVWKLEEGCLIVVAYFVVSVVFYWILAFSVKCPKCRVPVRLRPRRFMGIEFYTWSYLTPEKCRHCGEPLP